MGRRMRAGVRDTDIVARYAGDEFVILLDQIDYRRSAERLRVQLEGKLAEPIEVRNGEQVESVAGGASIGIAVYPDDGMDVDSLINHADAEMYRHKQAERPA